MIHPRALLAAYLVVTAISLQPMTAASGASQNPWPRNVIDDSSRVPMASAWRMSTEMVCPTSRPAGRRAAPCEST